MPEAFEFGTSTTKRPGSETSSVRRAPFRPIGFFVTWQTIVWPGRSRCSIRVAPGSALDRVVPVGLHVAPVQHGVLRGADVDEGRLHARKDVLHPAAVDVAVDLVGVVLGAGDVVLDERAALEHGDLGRLGLDVDAHQVAPDRAALALPPRRREPRLVRVGRIGGPAGVASPSSATARRAARLAGGRRGLRGGRPLARLVGRSVGARTAPSGSAVLGTLGRCGRRRRCPCRRRPVAARACGGGGPAGALADRGSPARPPGGRRQPLPDLDEPVRGGPLAGRAPCRGRRRRARRRRGPGVADLRLRRDRAQRLGASPAPVRRPVTTGVAIVGAARAARRGLGLAGR